VDNSDAPSNERLELQDSMNVLAIAPLTRVEQVRRAVLHQIFNGDLGSGDRLVESLLAKQFGVAQATVNSALQDLHAQGIVTKELNRATRVSQYEQDELRSMFEVRLILEPAAAEAASRNVARLGVGGLRSGFQGMHVAARAQDLAGFILADYEFHQEIYRLTDNRFLQQACQAIAAAPFAYVLCNCLEPLPTDYSSLANDHLEVTEAIIEGPEKAAAIVREQISTWLGWSMGILDRKPASGHAVESVAR
jgi:DNA-binding GntR family transcriptional regulator